MWRHYLLVAVRNMMRNRRFVFINLTGLATGIAFCILSGLFVWHEWRYDLFHKDIDRIYRVIEEVETPNGVGYNAMLPQYLGLLLADYVPEIEKAVRISDGLEGRIRIGEEVFKERPYFVDPEFFTLFSFPLLMGDSEQVLRSPQSIVITDVVARKYFGDEEPIGKELTLIHYKWRYDPKTFVVQGVVQKPPENSSIKFDLLLPIDILPKPVSYRSVNGKMQPVKRAGGIKINFRSASDRVYVRLPNDADIAQFEDRMADFVALHQEENPKRRRDVALKLQPFRDVHFAREVGSGLQPTGNPVYAYIVMGISFGVLLIACINFVNLSLARSGVRALEVGVRKIVGAKRKQLMVQFWCESILLTGTAFVLALAMAEFFLPVFGNLMQTKLTMNYDPLWFAFLIALSFVVALVAGSFPAVVLSRFSAVAALKNRFRLGGKHWFGRVFVVFQFVVSALFIIGAVVVSAQLSHLQNKDLGFDKDQVVIVSADEWVIPGGFWEARRKRSQGLEVYQNALKNYGGVVDVARVDRFVSQDATFGPLKTQLEFPDREAVLASKFPIGYDFLNTMNIELLQGRNFSQEHETDVTDAVIVNEALVRALGLTEPLGQTLPFRNSKLVGELEVAGKNPRIVGVVKDFHYRSLHESMEPLIMHLNPKAGWDIFVRIKPEGVPETLAFMKAKWVEVTDGASFAFEFLDERVERQYQAEMRWGWIIQYASLFAIFVACLGALGLTAQAVAHRTKEIGIRKVLGASSRQIVTLLSKEFVWMVGFANVIALPLAYHALGNWLQNFAYRVDMGVGILLVGICLTMGLALTTVILQAYWAAQANPVDALRNE